MTRSVPPNEQLYDYDTELYYRNGTNSSYCNLNESKIRQPTQFHNIQNQDSHLSHNLVSNQKNMHFGYKNYKSGI